LNHINIVYDGNFASNIVKLCIYFKKYFCLKCIHKIKILHKHLGFENKLKNYINRLYVYQIIVRTK